MPYPNTIYLSIMVYYFFLAQIRSHSPYSKISKVTMAKSTHNEFQRSKNVLCDIHFHSGASARFIFSNTVYSQSVSIAEPI